MYVDPNNTVYALAYRSVESMLKKDDNDLIKIKIKSPQFTHYLRLMAFRSREEDRIVSSSTIKNVIQILETLALYPSERMNISVEKIGTDIVIS